jgi:hypothetical protein
MAVCFWPSEIAEDGQDWLSYKNRKLTNLSVVDCVA